MTLFLTPRRRRAAVLVEYGLVIAGVSLVAAAAVAIFGHKTSDLFAAVATVLPGAHADDNGPIVSGKLIETTAADPSDPTVGISIDTATIANETGDTRLGNNLGTDLSGLVLEAE